MADFDTAIAALLANEGGYVNDPNDPGGETNFGISKRYHPDLDIKNLTRDQAIAIYKSEFWDKYQLNSLTSIDVATKCLDLLVNPGTHDGAVIVQKALVELGLATTVDGVFGLQTLAHCNQVRDPVVLLVALRAQTAIFYAEDVLSGADRKYLNDWMHRAVKP